MQESAERVEKPDAATLRALRCARCGVRSPARAVCCISCGKVILAQFDHLLLIGIALVLVAVNVGVSVAAGAIDWRLAVHPVTVQLVPTLALGMLLVKGMQKLRNPQRRIGLELMALYSDRQGRMLVVLWMMAMLWLGRSLWRGSTSPLQSFDGVLALATLGVTGSYLVFYFRTLGRGFFDLSKTDAINGHPEAIRQSRRHGLLKKLARAAVLHRLQGEPFALNLDFYARGWAHLYGFSPEQGERILSTAEAGELALFEEAFMHELREARRSAVQAEAGQDASPS